MATFLRRPVAGHVARLSTRTADSIIRSPCPIITSQFLRQSRLPAVITARRVRTYATQGPDPNKNEADNGKKQSKLSPEDQKLLDDLFREMERTMPPSQRPHLKEVREQFEKNGFPPEMRTMIQNMNQRDGIPSLVDMLRVAKAVTKSSFTGDKSSWTSNMNMNPGEGEKKDGQQPQQQEQNEGKEPEKSAQEQPQQQGRDEQQAQNQKNEQGQEGQNQDQNQNRNQQNGQRRRNQQQQGKPFAAELKLDTTSIVISAFLSYLLWQSFFPSGASRDITWQEFRSKFFDKGLVEKLTVLNGSRVRVDLNSEAVSSMYADSQAAQPGFHYYFTIGSVESFERRIDEAQNELGIPSTERIPVAYEGEVPWFSALLSFGPTLLLLLPLFFLSRRAGSGAGGRNGIFGIGKSRARQFNHETDIKVKFSDVAGMDEAKVEIMEFVSFLKQPERFQKLGAKIPRGAILSGPPGTGKTLLAKATAGESGVPFFSVSGSEFVEMFVGVGASRVRDLFANARKHTPCIIFIDEIDAIGKSRAKQAYGGGNDEREGTLNQILTEMDGFNTSEQVVVLAGTNRADVLDGALMRPGRFDRHINIDRPSMEGRKQIFGVHLRKIVTKEDIEYLKGRLSSLTPGFSGADIANCVNEAALVAARANAETVIMEHFEKAIERVVGGLERKSVVLSPDQKRTVAYHEAGHAICGWFFRWADPLLKVSIIPRGQGLGYAQYLPGGGSDMYLMDMNQIMDRMAMALGGRVSEELHFPTVTSGASDDFNKVTQMATQMVTRFGMSPKLRYIYYEDDPRSQMSKPFSDQTARDIDTEVRRIVDEAHQQCRNLLDSKRKELEIVAEELLSKEVLTRDDLIRLLGPRDFPEPGEFTKYFGGGQTVAPPDHQSSEETTGKDGREQSPYPT